MVFQMLVQRALAAKNITHAKAGCLFAAYLKFTPFVTMLLPGMISRALYPGRISKLCYLHILVSAHTFKGEK